MNLLIPILITITVISKSQTMQTDLFITDTKQFHNKYTQNIADNPNSEVLETIPNTPETKTTANNTNFLETSPPDSCTTPLAPETTGNHLNTSKPTTSDNHLNITIPETTDTTSNSPTTKPPYTTPSTHETETTSPIQNENSSEIETDKIENVLPTYENQVVALVNEERAKMNLPPLAMSENLNRAALIRAKETVTNFSHTRPNGMPFSSVLNDNDISYRGSGENIAWGQRTPEEVVRVWMNSEGHRANILNKNYTSIGVGYHLNGSTPYWVQLLPINKNPFFTSKGVVLSHNSLNNYFLTTNVLIVFLATVFLEVSFT